jgi:hypothetical protein
MGVTKAFIKNPETVSVAISHLDIAHFCAQLFALEHMRDRYWHNMAARIQRAFRNYLRYKQECASRIQRFWKSKKDGLAFLQLRDYSHQLLGGRKERRRYSLVSMRQFNGDYLDVGGKSPSGELLRSACGIGSGEQVAFSMNGQILVSKLGRSSTRSPRYLVLVRANRWLAPMPHPCPDIASTLHCHHPNRERAANNHLRTQDTAHDDPQRWHVQPQRRLDCCQRSQPRRGPGPDVPAEDRASNASRAAKQRHCLCQHIQPVSLAEARLYPF